MKLDKALYQRVFNELSKAADALENVHKMKNALDASHSEVKSEFIALKIDYEEVYGRDSFAKTEEHDLFISVLTNLDDLSRINSYVEKFIYSLDEIKDGNVEPVIKAADKLR